MTDADGNNDRLARPDNSFLAVDGEVRFACGDHETFLLVRVQVLGDRTAGQAAPVKADDILLTVLTGRREGDRLAGGRVGELPEPGSRGVCAGHGLRSFVWQEWGEPFCVRYQSTVAVMAVASGVPVFPNADSYFVVSSTKDSSNS